MKYNFSALKNSGIQNAATILRNGSERVKHEISRDFWLSTRYHALWSKHWIFCDFLGQMTQNSSKIRFKFCIIYQRTAGPEPETRRAQFLPSRARTPARSVFKFRVQTRARVRQELESRVEPQPRARQEFKSRFPTRAWQFFKFWVHKFRIRLFFQKFWVQQIFFRIALVNRPENGFLGGKIFWPPIFAFFGC